MRRLLALAIFILTLLTQLATLQHCATPVAPTGGPRDTIPPQLVPEESTPNFQTDFRPEEIRLTFDEWVSLDGQEEIIISPPIVFPDGRRPTLDRRTLIFDLEGVDLRDSVTYVFNIGAAITDNNEDNPTENLRFVFATGPVLDTAEVSGTLVDAFSGDPLEATVFALFGNLADSAVVTENPTYFAQSDEEGAFTVYNVRPGRYRAVALQRNPAATNYFLDYEGNFSPLAVGFVDTVITVGPVTTEVGNIRLSPVPVPVRIADVDTSAYGTVKLRFNQPAENVVLTTGEEYIRRNDKDTALLYYQGILADTIIAGLDTFRMDTAYVTRLDTTDLPPLAISRRSRGAEAPVEGIRLLFNRPVRQADTSLLRLVQDTLPLPLRPRPLIELDSTDPNGLRIAFPFNEAAPYTVRFLPGAVTDYLGRSNSDTLVGEYRFQSAERYGQLTVELINLNPTFYYVVRLVKGDDAIIGTKRVIRERFAYTARYPALKPDTYTVEVLYDANRNGLYDGGDFRFFRQPEALRRVELAPLRPNWEVTETIDLEAAEVPRE